MEMSLLLTFAVVQLESSWLDVSTYHHTSNLNKFSTTMKLPLKARLRNYSRNKSQNTRILTLCAYIKQLFYKKI